MGSASHAGLESSERLWKMRVPDLEIKKRRRSSSKPRSLARRGASEMERQAQIFCEQAEEGLWFSVQESARPNVDPVAAANEARL